MTLDEYVTWTAGLTKSQPTGVPEERTLREVGLAFAREIGEVAGALVKCPHDDNRWRDELADELGDVAYYWARAHIEWRRAGRPAGGPASGVGAVTLEEYAVWATGPADRPDDQTLTDVGLALVGDAGEVVECLRKLVREGERQRERLAGELGDVKTVIA